MVPFSIVVATDSKGGIGYNNSIPWRIKKDMAWFKELTTTGVKKNCVIMGRKTWDSLPEKNKPLPDRYNIVITRNKDQCTSKYKVGGFIDAMEMARGFGGKIFIIGGQSIYELAMKQEELVSIYLTLIKEQYECDVFFPKIKHFSLVKSHDTGKENGVYYEFLEYKKNNY